MMDHKPFDWYDGVTRIKRPFILKTMYYVVQVQTGKEEQTIADIRKYKSDKTEFEVFAPSRLVKRKYGNEYKEVSERCFPGYVFVETDNPKDLFFDLYWVPEFTRLLGREGLTYNFVPLNEEESRMVDILYNAGNGRVTPISDIEIEAGDTVRILDGPLRDVQAQIKAVDLHKRNVTVGVTFCNRIMDVKLGINIVTKVPKY